VDLGFGYVPAMCLKGYGKEVGVTFGFHMVVVGVAADGAGRYFPRAFAGMCGQGYWMVGHG